MLCATNSAPCTAATAVMSEYVAPTWHPVTPVPNDLPGHPPQSPTYSLKHTLCPNEPVDCNHPLVTPSLPVKGSTGSLSSHWSRGGGQTSRCQVMSASFVTCGSGNLALRCTLALWTLSSGLCVGQHTESLPGVPNWVSRCGGGNPLDGVGQWHPQRLSRG